MGANPARERSEAREKWATFDCYGTLIDWNAGVASVIGAYKPAHGHWLAFERRTGRPPDVHVAASHFHDIAPATELGLPTVWINREHEAAEPRPTRELRDLGRLPETLDELVPA